MQNAHAVLGCSRSGIQTMYVELVVIAVICHFHKYAGSPAFRLMVYVSGILVMPIFHADGSRCATVPFIPNSNTSFTQADSDGNPSSMGTSTPRLVLRWRILFQENPKLVHLSSMNLVPTSAESVNWQEAAVLSFVYTNFHSPVTFGGFNSLGYYVASSLKSSVVARVCPLKCHMKSPG